LLYGEFYERVKDYIDEDGFLETEKHSLFIKNHFWLQDKIEEKTENGIKYWRPLFRTE